MGLKVDIGTEVIETETGIRVIATRKLQVLEETEPWERGRSGRG